MKKEGHDTRYYIIRSLRERDRQTQTATMFDLLEYNIPTLLVPPLASCPIPSL